MRPNQGRRGLEFLLLALRGLAKATTSLVRRLSESAEMSEMSGSPQPLMKEGRKTARRRQPPVGFTTRLPCLASVTLVEEPLIDANPR